MAGQGRFYVPWINSPPRSVSAGDWGHLDVPSVQAPPPANRIQLYVELATFNLGLRSCGILAKVQLSSLPAPSRVCVTKHKLNWK